MSAEPVLYFAGGGTGGHLFPGIALARRWKASNPETRIVFVGSERVGERRILESCGYEHVPLTTESSARLWKNPVRFASRNFRALIAARRLLRRTPNIAGIVGLGGFASAPLLTVARWMKQPYLMLEQNAIPGRTNRTLSRGAMTICCAYAEAVKDFPRGTNCRVTGTPVRSEIAALTTKEGSSWERSSLEQSPQRLLVLGGSLGAKPVNSLMLLATEKIPELRKWEILHQTGEEDFERVRESYARMGQTAITVPFLNEMDSAYREATFAVARAGGVTLSELSCAGVPAVLVPLPTAADNHQLANARHYEACGGSIVVQQRSPLEAGLAEFINALRRVLQDSQRRVEMRSAMHSAACPHATEDVYQLMLRMLQARP